jgi:hypothetical protein
MDRREVIKNISLMTGVAFIGAEVFLQSGCKPKDSTTGLTLTETDTLFLDEVGETIIPATETPGAKAVGTGIFMKMMIQDCYSNDERAVVLKGIKEMKEEFKKQYKSEFTESGKEQKTEFLQKLDMEAREYNKNNTAAIPHFFTMLKQLTILGYFTSEAGATQALRYVAVPGKYDGAFPYKKGDKAWAT